MRTIIFNPEYHLRQDGNRVILFSNDSVFPTSDEWFSFIHPFHAMMLSFFNGNKSYETEIENCAQFFSIPNKNMYQIVQRFINNKCWFGITRSNKATTIFPKNVLLWCNEIGSAQRKEIYSPSNFSYSGEPDLKNIRLHYPLSINMELTMKCYANCIYCYANRNLKNKSLLSLDEIINFIRQAKHGGVYNFDINGGEVLLHPKIKDILLELVQNGYKPLVSTKMALNKDIIDFIAQLKEVRLQISLDSANTRLLHKMIGVPYDYLSNLSSSLEYLSTIGFHIKINVVLTRYNSNKDEINRLLDFLAKYEAISEVRFNPCGYSLYKPGFNDLILSTQQMNSILKYIENQRSNYSGFLIKFSSFDKREDFSPLQKAKLFANRALCTGGTRNAVLLPNGDITICEELYEHSAFILGNIKKNSLDEIWNSPKALKLYQSPIKLNSNSECKHCPSLSECRTEYGVCWKMVLMAYGMENWDYPDPRCPKAPQPYNTFFYE